jgi:O-antigen/teichoic acid export membrane protein
VKGDRLPAPDGGSLRHSAVRGVKWTTLSTVVVTVVGLVQLAILTRLLTKTDFGLMAMIATVVGFAQVYADAGFSNAIIYRQDATRRQLSSLYWTNLIVSLALGALVALAAPLIAAFFGEPSLVAPLRLICLSFVIVPLGQQFQVLLQRDLEFDLLARRDIAASLAGLVVAVGTAAAGQGVYALVWGQLTTVTVKSFTTAAVGWRRWRPSLHLRWGDLHGFLSFGLYQLGERSIYYWAANIDYLLIGRYLGPEQLGIYTVAYNLVVMPVSKLNPVLAKVAFPVFAKRQTDAEALRRGFGELVELVAVVTFPLLVGLGVTASIAVPVLFGPEWQPAVVLVQIMVAMGMLKCLSNPLGSVLLAKGRADVGFWLNVAATAVTIPALWAVVGRGTEAVAWAHTALNLTFFFVELLLIRHVVGMGVGRYLRRLARPSAATAVMGVVVALALLLTDGSLPDAAELVLLVAIGVAVYLLTWLIMARDYMLGLVRLFIRQAPAGSQ